MFTVTNRHLSRYALVNTLVALVLSIAPCITQAATQQELEAQVKSMEQQLEMLKTELSQLKQQVNQSQNQAQTQTQPASPATAVMQNTPEPVRSSPTFFGYGELNYSSPRDNAANASADVARFVIGVGYQFDEKTHLNSELEIEHAVSSSSDPGEVEVEQAYIDHEIHDGVFLKAGLFLIPSGLLNENHEPTRYYGVFRNFVETSIIPTTWREGGVAIQGNTGNGLRWDAGLTTGFDLSKWDFSGESEGHESPLGSIHQELALARAKDASVFAALNYTGINNLKLGASLFTGGASQGQLNTSSHVTLWETHGRWTPGSFDMSALYARGHISNTEAINTTVVGNPTLIPENFFGWYVQGAYHAWQHDNYKLSPFVRYERFNTAASFAEIQAGLTLTTQPDQQAWTGGFNLEFAPGVVLKADYVSLKNSDNSDRFDLGLGYQF
jgi:hypothetical protein